MANAVKRKKSNPRENTEKKHARKWSARVMQTSDALDLEANIFKSSDPGDIARSLKRSAEKSRRKKGTPFQSAMSMLNFYINRAGKTLSERKKGILEKSKNSLREVFNRAPK